MDNLNPLLSIIIKCSSTEFLGYKFMLIFSNSECRLLLQHILVLFFVAH
jgi:hypothetical protein